MRTRARNENKLPPAVQTPMCLGCPPPACEASLFTRARLTRRRGGYCAGWRLAVRHWWSWAHCSRPRSSPSQGLSGRVPHDVRSSRSLPSCPLDLRGGACGRWRWPRRTATVCCGESLTRAGRCCRRTRAGRCWRRAGLPDSAAACAGAARGRSRRAPPSTGGQRCQGCRPTASRGF